MNSIIRVMKAVDNQPVEEKTIIIKGNEMSDENTITDQELDKIMNDLMNADVEDEDFEYLGDEDMDDEDTPDVEIDDIPDEEDDDDNDATSEYL